MTQIDCDPDLRDHQIISLTQRVLSSCEGQFNFQDHVDYFKSILTSDIVLQSLKLGLKKINDDSLYELDNFTMEGPVRSWKILETEFFTISAGYRSAGWDGACNEPLFDYAIENLHGDSVTNDLICLEPAACDVFYGVLSDCNLSIGHYDVVYPGDGSQDSSCSLKFTMNNTMHKNDFFLVSAGKEIQDSTFDGTLLYLMMYNKPTVRILPRFSMRDKHFVGWSSGDADASRLELIGRTMVELQYTPGSGALEELTHHQDHYVRWNSMRSLLRLDEDAGVRRIRSAASDDPNLEVRHAAQQTLALIAKFTSEV